MHQQNTKCWRACSQGLIDCIQALKITFSPCSKFGLQTDKRRRFHPSNKLAGHGGFLTKKNMLCSCAKIWDPLGDKVICIPINYAENSFLVRKLRLILIKRQLRRFRVFTVSVQNHKTTFIEQGDFLRGQNRFGFLCCSIL